MDAHAKAHVSAHMHPRSVAEGHDVRGTKTISRLKLDLQYVLSEEQAESVARGLGTHEASLRA